MEQLIDNLSGHFILCGFGRIGRQITQEYIRNDIPFVVVDVESTRVDAMDARGLPHIFGDASDESILIKAGINRAAGLIAVTPTDAVNTFIVLTARGLRQDLLIVARADATHNVEKLYRAGATKVVSPYTLGGRWMGITAVNPAVTDFVTAMTEMDHSVIQVREMTVGSAGEIRGQTFETARLHDRTGALVVAVRTKTGHFIPNPPNDYLFKVGDILVAMGSPGQLTEMAKLADHLNPLKPLAIGKPVM